MAHPVRLSSPPVIPPPAAEPPPVEKPRRRRPVADERMLEILAPLLHRLPGWVTVFPRRVGGRIKPLPTGIRAALAVLLPPGDERALADLDEALNGYTASPLYRAALTMPAAQRHNLTGRPVSRVRGTRERWERIDAASRRALLCAAGNSRSVDR